MFHKLADSYNIKGGKMELSPVGKACRSIVSAKRRTTLLCLAPFPVSDRKGRASSAGQEIRQGFKKRSARRFP